MDNEKLHYIEEFGLFFEQLGLTRMTGRIFGYMIVSNEEHHSFDVLQEQLRASKGSISGSLKLLENTGFIRKTSLPGQRKTYYQISRVDFGDMLMERMQVFVRFSEILEKGNRLKDKQDAVSDWVAEAAAFYRWAVNGLEEMVGKWSSVKGNLPK